MVWLNSAQKQIFVDKIFMVECEARKATPTKPPLSAIVLEYICIVPIATGTVRLC